MAPLTVVVFPEGLAEGTGVVEGAAVVCGVSSVGGLMSTPADLQRPTAAVWAFCWSAFSHWVLMHAVAALMNASLEQEHTKSVSSQSVVAWMLLAKQES